ncbi:MAG TPA: phosphoribosylpyrophosphate synthetase [Ignavibacteria bacterium]|nr:phosphoribosylpyrophosphate synthetase [Ignavibacteria bacterium]HAX50260.1 phosphoribosylpyrophosphate synthetase [Bacteroidota bacterium]HRE09466.1 phosphoribosylpyrophosphate synthetase [Ignavibacteria bacterium]HRF64590.1 phosphoribosylpyrophosphate synthetase [Ignavibacteria bacterium]HRJ05739.1 phosphoribosylpyrophosphate synthetase [Ignavibacteria bacterium]
MYSYDTLSEALNDLEKRGYTRDFNIECDSIVCKSIELKLHPGDFEISEYYRFEGESDPDDSEIVYAITSKEGIKGTIVNGYGIYSDEISDEMLRKLKIAT